MAVETALTGAFWKLNAASPLRGSAVYFLFLGLSFLILKTERETQLFDSPSLFWVILFRLTCLYTWKCLLIVGFPGSSDGKESACNAGDLCSIPGLGRSPGGGYGNPFQYSCLESSIDRGAWQATVNRVTNSQTQLKWLCTHAHILTDFRGGTVVKNVPANVPAADTRDGFDPRLGRSPGVGNSQKKKRAWKITWTEEPGVL